MSAQAQLSEVFGPSPAPNLKSPKIELKGTGGPGESILTGLLESGKVARENVVATTAHRTHIETVGEHFQIRATPQNTEAIMGANLILLSVKPQSVEEVLTEIRDGLLEVQLIMSAAASISTVLEASRRTKELVNG